MKWRDAAHRASVAVAHESRRSNRGALESTPEDIRFLLEAALTALFEGRVTAAIRHTARALLRLIAAGEIEATSVDPGPGQGARARSGRGGRVPVYFGRHWRASHD